MDKPIRILMVEDAPEDQELAERVLAKAGLSFETERVETEASLRRALAARCTDLVISDFSLPTYDGVSALRLVKAECPDLPFILVTGSLDEETAVEIMKAGADDYVLKDRIVRLGPAVISVLEKAAIRASEAQAREALHRSERALAQARTLETLGMLAGGVAHEVRNPLFTLSTVTAALEKKLGDRSDVEEYLTHIKDQVRRLGILMDDLLSLGRPLDTSKIRSCELGPIARKACDAVCATRPGKVCPARFDIAPSLKVVADPERLHQVFVNLLQNANDFSPADGSVTVSAASRGQDVVVTVEDGGPGIPADLMPNLFTPFASRRKGGTGMGLAIVQKIVSDHGGTIEARNRKRGGAAFTVVLPGG